LRLNLTQAVAIKRQKAKTASVNIKKAGLYAKKIVVVLPLYC
jgi:hypothetical protein